MQSVIKWTVAAAKILFALLVMLLLTACVRLAFLRFYRSAYPTHYREFVSGYSEKNNLPPSLVYAVIRTESGFDPSARSHVDAYGLMQITEDTFHWAQFRENEQERLSVDLLYDSDVNIRYGTAILRIYMEEFGSAENALCAYHAGRGKLQEWLRNPDLSEDGVNISRIPSRVTAYYVERVLETKDIYDRLYDLE